MALTDNLAAYWKLDEVSTGAAAVARADSNELGNTSPLTDNGTTASATGRIGNAAKLVSANSEYLSSSSTLLITGNVDFTFACWTQLTLLSSGLWCLASKYGTTQATQEWTIYKSSSHQLTFSVSGPANSKGVIHPLVMALGPWYFVVAWHDAVNDQIGIQINNEPPEMASYSDGVNTTVQPFYLGLMPPSTRWDGLIDEAGLWKRVLSPSERLELYNGGLGQTNPFAPLTRSLSAYWRLDEASGNRADILGVSALTDVNTVTSAAGKQGLAASFASATSEALTVADNVPLSTGDVDFMFACWCYPLTLTGYPCLASKGWASAAGPDREWCIFLDSADNRLWFSVQGSAEGGVHSSTALSINTWYFVVAWHDTVNNQIGIQVNNGTPDIVTHPTGVQDGAGAFRLGSSDPSHFIFWNGRIDEAGFWKRVLTSDERTKLYMGGVGNTYPFPGVAVKNFTQAVINANGIATAPADTAIGDLIISFVWSQGTVIPTHTIRTGFTTIRTHAHDDGTTDGRLSVACSVATVAGAQTYQPYTIANGTAGQTCAALLVVVGADTTGPALWVQSSVTTTDATAPDPPAIDLNGEALILAIGAWHVTTAAATVTTPGAGYLEIIDGPTGSHVTHLAVAARGFAGVGILTGVSGDPGIFVDNVTPNGAVAMTIAIPAGAVEPPTPPTFRFRNRTYSRLRLAPAFPC